MSSGNAFVKVWCDAQGCREEIEVSLPFVYSGVMHTIGHYDHSDETISKLAEAEGFVIQGDRHFCSPEHQEEANV